jgi:hypothetical protein
VAGPYYVDSTKTGGGNTGANWTNAFVAFGSAVTAATADGDIIYVAHNHSESLSADTSYTFANNVRVLCVNSGTGALATTAVIGAQSSTYGITIATTYLLYLYGLIFKTGASTGSDNVSFGGTGDGAMIEAESCTAWLSSTGTGSRINLSSQGAGVSNFYRYINCVFRFSNATQRIIYGNAPIELISCSVHADSTEPDYLFSPNTNSSGGASLLVEGCDFTEAGDCIVWGDVAGSGVTDVQMINTKFAAGCTIKEAATTVLHKGNLTVTARNCDVGDTRYLLYHGDAFGETTATYDKTASPPNSTVYANSGALYDGTYHCSWKIVTTANCNYYYPYVSPWMDVYHSGTSAITPYLEILRSGSTTAYQDDDVWGEFSYQGTSGSTKATIVSDRMTPLGTAADQTASSLGASDWTGEHASDNAYQKLAPTSAITPAEIGHLRARVCVGEPSITVYVDPTIRGTGSTDSMSRVTPTGWMEYTAGAALVQPTYCAGVM